MLCFDAFQQLRNELGVVVGEFREDDFGDFLGTGVAFGEHGFAKFRDANELGPFVVGVGTFGDEAIFEEPVEHVNACAETEQKARDDIGLAAFTPKTD